MIVKVEITFQCWEEFETCGEIARVNQFVLERAPQPFDKNIVEGAATAIHADQDATLVERSQEFGGGELRALIGVPDFGLAKAERGIERSQAKAGFEGVGEFPTEHEAVNQSITATK